MVRTLPKIGLGSSGLGIRFGAAADDPDECLESVDTALDVGYRHIDTAQMYGNEHLIGQAIEDAPIPRNDVFLATKVDPSKLAYDDVLSSTEESLEALRTDYIDLLYVHWPINAYDPEDTLPAFDELRDQGKIRHVGVSNFTVDLLDEAQQILDAPIVANQMQVHPMLPPTEGERAELLPYAAEHDIDIVSWSPLVRGDGLQLPEVQEVARKHDISPAQAIFSWLFEYDIKIIVKSTSRQHLQDNLGALVQPLDQEDIELIESVEDRQRLFDREEAPWNQ